MTFAIEMIVCFVFSNYTDTFNKYPLLIAFQPVISAISGNVGLQSSSINVRALAVGIVTPSSVGKAVIPEVKAAFLLGIMMGAVNGTVAFLWSHFTSPSEGGSSSIQGSAAFGVACAFGMLVSNLTAGLTGAFAPVLFKFLGFDPSAMAGPMETAFQDVIGGTILLFVSAWILNHFGDAAQDCTAVLGDKSTVVDDLSGCLAVCVPRIGQVFQQIHQSCIDHCAALASAGSCS